MLSYVCCPFSVIKLHWLIFEGTLEISTLEVVPCSQHGIFPLNLNGKAITTFNDKTSVLNNQLFCTVLSYEDRTHWPTYGDSSHMRSILTYSFNSYLKQHSDYVCFETLCTVKEITPVF